MSFPHLTGVRKAFGTNTVCATSISRSSAANSSPSSARAAAARRDLRIVAGFEAPSAGEIRISGQDVTHLRANSAQSHGVPSTRCSQHDGAATSASAQGRAQVAATSSRGSTRCWRDQAAAARRTLPYQLSGAAAARLAARALAPSPQILLLDEPLSASTRASASRCARKSARCSAVRHHHDLRHHDQEEAVDVGPRRRDERSAIEQVGSPSEIYNAPRNSLRRSFVARSSAQRQIVERRSGRSTSTPARDDAAQAQRRQTRRHPAVALRPEALRSAKAATIAHAPGSSRTSPSRPSSGAGATAGSRSYRMFNTAP